MYFTTSDVTATIIALGMAILMIVLLTYANYILLKQNRFLKDRLKANRIARMRIDNHNYNKGESNDNNQVPNHGNTSR